MKALRIALLAALIAGLSPAIAQQFNTLPGGTVVGRMTGPAGPAQPIPFATLFAQGGVPSTRLISTTAPLAGGGNLTADRTLSITGVAGQVLAGSGPAFTAAPTLGVAGSTVGSVTFANATSGSVQLKPATGALGTAIASLPAGTYNVVGDSLTQTLTNKTLDNTNAITIKVGNLTLQDGTDTTKQAVFALSGITTATTRTYTAPNANGTLAISATSPVVLNSTTGNLTCTTCATTTNGGALSASAPLALSAGGAITITGAAGQVLAGATPAFTATPLLGVAGSTVGTLGFANGTSGSVTLQPTTGALGSAVLTLPAITDTLAGKALANGGTNNALTASNGGIVWSDASKLNVLSGTATANLPLVSGATATPAWGAFGLPASVTSGGVACFTSTSLMASSVLMTLNGVMLGNGAGNCPQVTAVGTNGQLFLGVTGSAPNWASMSQDATITNAGVITVTKTNNVAFTSAATTSTGTSGATIPLNNGNNTFSGNNTYSGTSTWSGSLIVKMRTVTGAGAITVSATTDYFICVNKASGAATTVNLPSSPATGLTFLIKDCKGDAATNNITITPAAGNIDNAGTYVMNSNLSSVAVTYDGTGWFVN